jgi:hypothetical protein
MNSLQTQDALPEMIKEQPRSTCNDNALPAHVSFVSSRQPEESGSLFERLLHKSTIYGVTDELAQRVLKDISLDALSAELKALISDHEACARVAARSYLHGNGFYKLVVHTAGHAKVRLHFWVENQQAEENIHNHRWRLCSRVIFGELKSEIYQQCFTPSDAALTLEARRYAKSVHQLDAEGVRLGRQRVELVRQETRAAGEAYAMDVDTLHKIVRHADSAATLTLMVQSAPIYADNYMLSNDNVEEPNLSPQPLSPAELKELLAQICERLDQSREAPRKAG